MKKKEKLLLFCTIFSLCACHKTSCEILNSKHLTRFVDDEQERREERIEWALQEARKNISEENLAPQNIMHFASASAQLDKSAIENLDKNIIPALQKEPDLEVITEGYCDERGSKKYNEKLGEKRAQAIKDYLINVGKIDPKRVTAISYGKSDPIDSAHNKEAWQKNRRVTIITLATMPQ